MGNIKKFCKLDRCKGISHCKGFCRPCYNKFYSGKIDEKGNPINGYVPLPTKCRFPGCEKTRKDHLRNGLCNKHRKWAERGIIDKDTCEILDESKVPRQKEYTHCKISGCLGKHKAKGFCRKHYVAFKVTKSIDENGKRLYGVREKYDYTKVRKCCVRTCERVIDGKSRDRRLVKGFCAYHYQLHKKGYYNEFGMRIKELDFLSGKELKKVRTKRFRDLAKAKAIRIEWDDSSKTIKRWSQITKIPKGTIKNRYKRGLPVEFIFYKGDLRTNEDYKKWKREENQDDVNKY